jgi:hypothetical protein
LYGCETWSFTLREAERLRVFENRVLRRIFGPKRDEMTGEWRLRNKELNVLYSSPNVVRVIKSRGMRYWRRGGGGVCGTYGGGERCIQDFGRETLRKETTWETQA